MSKQEIVPGFKIDGVFSFSDLKKDEIIEIPGILTIDENGLTAVSFLDINKSTFGISNKIISIPRVTGIVERQNTQTSYVTLLNCSLRVSSLSFGSSAQTKYLLTTATAFFDEHKHFPDKMLQRVGFSTDKLHNWFWSDPQQHNAVQALGKTGRVLKNWHQKNVKYLKVPLLYLDKKYLVTVDKKPIAIQFKSSFDSIYTENKAEEFKVKTLSSIEVDFKKAIEIEEIRIFILRFNQLLSLLSFKIHAFEEFYAPYTARQKIGTKFRKTKLKAKIIDYAIIASAKKVLARNDWFFCNYKLIESDFSKIFEQWFDRYDSLKEIVYVVLPTHKSELKSHVEIDYIQLTKALEAYSRNICKTASTSQGCVAEPFRYVFQSCPTIIEKLFIETLSADFGITNKNANKRLNSLVDKLVKLRNFITHPGTINICELPMSFQSKNVINLSKLYDVNIQLRLLILFLLFRELGFDTRFEQLLNSRQLSVMDEIS